MHEDYVKTSTFVYIKACIKMVIYIQYLVFCCLIVGEKYQCEDVRFWILSHMLLKPFLYWKPLNGYLTNSEEEMKCSIMPHFIRVCTVC